MRCEPGTKLPVPFVSDPMARENHIFTVVWKTAVGAEFDWRLPFFGTDPHPPRLRRHPASRRVVDATRGSSHVYKSSILRP